MIWQIITLYLCSLFGTCEGDGCETIKHVDIDHVICRYPVADIDVQLFSKDGQGKSFAYLRRLEKQLPNPPLMLMNGGMYHDDLGAVGLHVERGAEQKTISTKGGWGNFHLLPNGVFWGADGKIDVTETRRFLTKKPKVSFATQSGPMLVIDGKLHPRFLKDSDSRKIRNGVGISRDGKTLTFAISSSPVTFWEFGKLFQEKLDAHNALFLDGSISAIRTRGFTQGTWRALGPMIAVFPKQ